MSPASTASSESRAPAEPAGYAVNAQYYDLIFPQPVVEAAGAVLDTLLPGRRRVVELGAGTGRFTTMILDRLPDHARVHAVEPDPVMRAALATRLSDVPRASAAVTIVADDAAHAETDDPVDAVIALHVLTHFAPDERRQVWRHWAERAAPGAIVLVDAQYPQTPAAVPPTVMEGRRLGRDRYEVEARAEVLDGERVLWTMTYRARRGDEVVRADTVSFPSWVVSTATLDEELAAHGAVRLPRTGAGFLAWRLP